MSATSCAGDLRTTHAERCICVPVHGSWDIVKERRPATVGVELLFAGEERGTASGARVNSLAEELVVFPTASCNWRVRTLISDEGEYRFLPLSVPFSRRIRNCSGERTACHSLSDLVLGPPEDMARRLLRCVCEVGRKELDNVVVVAPSEYLWIKGEIRARRDAVVIERQSIGNRAHDV
jgi:hypothetical protein